MPGSLTFIFFRIAGRKLSRTSSPPARNSAQPGRPAKPPGTPAAARRRRRCRSPSPAGSPIRRRDRVRSPPQRHQPRPEVQRVEGRPAGSAAGSAGPLNPCLFDDAVQLAQHVRFLSDEAAHRAPAQRAGDQEGRVGADVGRDGVVERAPVEAEDGSPPPGVRTAPGTARAVACGVDADEDRRGPGVSPEPGDPLADSFASQVAARRRGLGDQVSADDQEREGSPVSGAAPARPRGFPSGPPPPPPAGRKRLPLRLGRRVRSTSAIGSLA